MAGVTWVNADGLPVRFGPTQGQRGPRAGVTMGAGRVRELVATVNLAGAARTIYSEDLNGDGVVDGFDGLDTQLPAGALILGENVVVKTPLAGGTNYSVGTYQLNGTVDNAAGIRTTAGADGAQVGTQLAADRYIAVTTTGVYTAGVITIVIRYVL